MSLPKEPTTEDLEELERIAREGATKSEYLGQLPHQGLIEVKVYLDPSTYARLQAEFHCQHGSECAEHCMRDIQDEAASLIVAGLNAREYERVSFRDSVRREQLKTEILGGMLGKASALIQSISNC